MKRGIECKDVLAKPFKKLPSWMIRVFIFALFPVVIIEPFFGSVTLKESIGIWIKYVFSTEWISREEYNHMHGVGRRKK